MISIVEEIELLESKRLADADQEDFKRLKTLKDIKLQSDSKGGPVHHDIKSRSKS